MPRFLSRTKRSPMLPHGAADPFPLRNPSLLGLDPTRRVEKRMQVILPAFALCTLGPGACTFDRIEEKHSSMRRLPLRREASIHDRHPALRTLDLARGKGHWFLALTSRNSHEEQHQEQARPAGVRPHLSSSCSWLILPRLCRPPIPRGVRATEGKWQLQPRGQPPPASLPPNGDTILR